MAENAISVSWPGCYRVGQDSSGGSSSNVVSRNVGSATESTTSPARIDRVRYGGAFNAGWPRETMSLAKIGLSNLTAWNQTVSMQYLAGNEADTGQLVLQCVSYRGRNFRFKHKLELWPFCDETGELLCLEYEPLGIHVFADTREMLLKELAEQICMLWDEYASEANGNLSPAAVQLKKRLLAMIEEVR